MKKHISSLPLALLALSLIFCPRQALPCGQTTHGEVSERAILAFDAEGYPDYHALITGHRDALQAGARFPDWGYPFGFHDEAEAAHWDPFLKAAANYLHDTYPRPWDEETEKTATFLLGVMAHNVADDHWHTRGRDGFLKVMGDQDFHGIFQDAHNVGDFGGDVLCAYELDLSWMTDSWYVPVDDMAQVYHDLGYCTVTPEILTTYNYLLFVASHAEKAGGALFFPLFSEPSPFMVEQFHDYFLGGLDDMAIWTAWRWREVIDWVENGVYLDEPSEDRVADDHGAEALEVSLFASLGLLSSPGMDVTVERTGRGVTFFLDRSPERTEDPARPRAAGPESGEPAASETPRAEDRSVTYTIDNPHAYLGTSLAVGDFDRDGLDDLAMGVPGFGRQGHSQLGGVYLAHGREGITGHERIDLSASGTELTLTGTEDFGRFGWALAVVDLDADGLDDLPVAAPTVGSRQRAYKGEVHVFFGEDEGLSTEPGLTIAADANDTNLGFSLAEGDCDGDGHDDLIIGAPNARAGGKQRGLVAVFLASAARTAGGRVSLDAADWTARGEGNYHWFGHHVGLANPSGRGRVLLVGAPTVNAAEGGQSVGRLYGYDFSDPGRLPGERETAFTVTGAGEFDKAASTFAWGDPFGTGETVLALATPTRRIGNSVQSGAVELIPFSVLQGDLALADLEPVATLLGDQAFARLGWALGFADFNGDGTDDLWVSEPWRKTAAGVEAGVVYLRLGGPDFPTYAVQGSDPTVALTLESTTPRSLYGSALAFPDVNGDGAADVAVAAKRATAGANESGSVRLVISPGCADADGDGYGSPASPVCADPRLDCDDTDPDVNPGTAEIGGNGVDDDCDGFVDEVCFVGATTEDAP